ncbi:MAG TPA: hypothetical protein VGS13_08475 [Stellaceae bacterium]|nr:hypothetical protein [Stellaceae bacterium]
MFDAMMLQVALSTASTVFGSLGVFCTYFSHCKPVLAAQALVFLGTAAAIAWTTTDS